MANPVGRPRTKLEDIPENWRQIMIEAAQEGGSKVEAMAALGIYKKAWATLVEDYPDEFGATVEECDILCQTWWEAQGRKMTTGSPGSAVVWKFNMQNRFNWREKTDAEHTSPDGSMSPRGKNLDDFYEDDV